MDLIEEFLQVEPSFINDSKQISDYPSEWQFDQMEKISNRYSIESICDEIFKSYDPAKHNRHLVALMLNMLIWHSTEHEQAILAYTGSSTVIEDRKIVGVIISKRLEWFPFGNPEKTLGVIRLLRNKYPEFTEDYNYWQKESELEIKKYSLLK